MVHIKRFKERVYGVQAIAYHRTSSEEYVKLIYKTGFKPGGGDMYGKGWYLTYDLESQMRESMAQTYGNVILKCKVNLYGYLIFDREVAKAVYGDRYRLLDQLNEMGVKMKRSFMDYAYMDKDTYERLYPKSYTPYSFRPENIDYRRDNGYMVKIKGMKPMVLRQRRLSSISRGQLEEIKDAFPDTITVHEGDDKFFITIYNLNPHSTNETYFNTSLVEYIRFMDSKDDRDSMSGFISGLDTELDEGVDFTSKLALRAYGHLQLNEDFGKVKGLVFTGEHDGRVIVSYDYNRIIPMAYMIDGGSPVDWKKVFAFIKKKYPNFCKIADESKKTTTYSLWDKYPEIANKNWRKKSDLLDGLSGMNFEHYIGIETTVKDNKGVSKFLPEYDDELLSVFGIDRDKFKKNVGEWIPVAGIKDLYSRFKELNKGDGA